MDACSDNPFKLETDNDVSSLFAFFGQVRDRLLYLLSDVRERIAHQHCSLQMSYKRIGLYDACMILYQRKWYALYSASTFRPFPLLRNLFEFYLNIYQMYLFRRYHCYTHNRFNPIIVTTSQSNDALYSAQIFYNTFFSTASFAFVPPIGFFIREN